MFKQGFIKRAQDYGLTAVQAEWLYKQAEPKLQPRLELRGPQLQPTLEPMGPRGSIGAPPPQPPRARRTMPEVIGGIGDATKAVVELPFVQNKIKESPEKVQMAAGAVDAAARIASRAPLLQKRQESIDAWEEANRLSPTQKHVITLLGGKNKPAIPAEQTGALADSINDAGELAWKYRRHIPKVVSNIPNIPFAKAGPAAQRAAEEIPPIIDEQMEKHPGIRDAIEIWKAKQIGKAKDYLKEHGISAAKNIGSEAWEAVQSPILQRTAAGKAINWGSSFFKSRLPLLSGALGAAGKSLGPIATVAQGYLENRNAHNYPGGVDAFLEMRRRTNDPPEGMNAARYVNSVLENWNNPVTTSRMLVENLKDPRLYRGAWEYGKDASNYLGQHLPNNHVGGIYNPAMGHP